MVEYYTSDIAILVRFQCNASTQRKINNEYSTAVSMTTFQVVDIGSIPITRIFNSHRSDLVWKSVVTYTIECF